MNRTSSLRAPVTAALAATALLAFIPACKKQEEKKPAATADAALTTDEQKVSYSIGYQIGGDMRQQAMIDRAALQKGLGDALDKAPSRISPEDMQKSFQIVQQKMQAETNVQAEKNLAAGIEFLTKNKAKPGVKITASGLQYEVLNAGSGPKPTTTSTVVVAYHGTLIDGTVFDSSVERGDTAEFPVTGVIAGWTEVLQLMPVGAKYKIYVPANLAYGPRARGKIPANSVLIFDVELKQIK